MQVRVLGTLELVTDDLQQIAIASHKLRRLLAALVLNAGSVVSADRLSDIVWGDEQPEHANAALHNLVSRLRGRLRAGGGDDDGQIALLTRAPGYTLAVIDDALDAVRFERLAGRARARLGTGPAEAAALLDEALTLWRGDAYAEFSSETFARFEAARLEELRATAEEQRVEAALALGDTDDAIARLELLSGQRPLRERPHAQLMMALSRAGRQADALTVYRGYRQRLADELGLEPSDDLRRLEQRVLLGDPDLGPPGPAHERADAPRIAPGARASDAPDPSAAGTTLAPTGNLPPPPDLFGRDDLVTRVGTALRDARVVTLTGPGGVGKTSVALRAAAALAPAHRDGAWWHELASVDDADAVTELVMTELDAQLRPGMSPVSGLVDYLRTQQSLLVLDNAEHVVDGVAALVAAVARECPDVRLLVTSRERIGVVDERVIAVPPLSVPARGTIADVEQARHVPAIALFSRRAAAVSAFALAESNHEIVAEICRRLDGMPLALELAATRMRSMSPTDLLDRLTWRFRVLGGTRRAVAARHRTLRAVVDWSYELLDERARLVFDRLSVFAGDFALDAAEQVVATTRHDIDPLDVADVVAELVDTSMVVAHTAGDAGRYSLLETLRAYGRQQLAARGEGAAARRAHAAYYTALAERLAGGLYDPDSRDSASVLDRAIDELRAAHAWSIEHDIDLALRLASSMPVFAEQRALGEAFAWTERTIEAAERADVTSRWLPSAYGAAALSARFRGDLEQAVTHAGRALEDAGGDDPRGALALYTLAEVALYEGRLEDVRSMIARIEQMSLRSSQRALLTWIRANAVLLQAYQGAAGAAVAAAEEMLATATRQHDPVSTAWSQYVLAESLVDAEPQRALPIAEEALARARALDERFLTGIALVTVSSLNARHGDAHRAVRLFRETVDRWHRAGNWTQQWVAIRSIVGLLVRLGTDEQAATLLGALSTRSTATEPFGADAERLAAARTTLTARLGSAAMTEAEARGAALRDDEVVAWVRRVLDDLTGDAGEG